MLNMTLAMWLSRPYSRLVKYAKIDVERVEKEEKNSAIKYLESCQKGQVGELSLPRRLKQRAICNPLILLAVPS